ncbi:MAG: hypothetical protein RLZZ241_1542 [Bacteroidota bacterium]|jgi:pantoate--beta-alanine ligase
MQLFRTVSEVADFRKSIQEKSLQLGLVPTMGALHSGHMSLVSRALAENEVVLVTVFVNPTQFNNTSDLEHYPRTLIEDLELLGQISEDLIVFAPEAHEIYEGEVVSEHYEFNGLDLVMEGASRPGHFDGVGTIVERLFRLIRPHRAYFGEKDYQQLQIIRDLTAKRNIPVHIIACPIVREASGLALSSRNSRLTQEQLLQASAIYRALTTAKRLFSTHNLKDISALALEELQKIQNVSIVYFQIADAESLQPADQIVPGKKYRAFLAVYFGEVRLIDNIALN